MAELGLEHASIIVVGSGRAKMMLCGYGFGPDTKNGIACTITDPLSPDSM
jgi:hypothetical protein